MRRILVIGIGAGDPDYLTMQAVKALNEADVFFVANKGSATDELVRLRREICERFITDPAYRFVELPDPARDRTAAAYEQAVAQWHAERAEQYEGMFLQEVAEDGCGAFLVWGDPMLYDSTLRVIDQIIARGQVEFTYQVIPGITSIQALAAQHRVPLNRIGEPIHITTGRRLLEAVPPSPDIVIMLDAHFAAKDVSGLDPATEIFWGAYLGTESEVLISGRLDEVAEEILLTRKELREQKGWIMDTYLLRQPVAPVLD
ncbi:precorrin-6A synthase (deacetylating) [Frankineae bacterium MT45]|nr:precorrin-6A synthase (deacetylating) [Frankineae bacterium MT45]